MRREAVTRYQTGSMGTGFDAEGLGNDIAAKFMASGRAKQRYLFEHYILTYSDEEMSQRVASMRRTAEQIRFYGITVKERNKYDGFTLMLSKSGL